MKTTIAVYVGPDAEKNDGEDYILKIYGKPKEEKRFVPKKGTHIGAALQHFARQDWNLVSTSSRGNIMILFFN